MPIATGWVELMKGINHISCGEQGLEGILMEWAQLAVGIMMDLHL